jgi:hypothetical protein
VTTSPVEVPRSSIGVGTHSIRASSRGDRVGAAQAGADQAVRSHLRPSPVTVALLGVLAVATFVRVWALDATGLNSDEVVYVTQGASLAGDPAFSQQFPIFRAHPLLFQSLLALIHTFSASDFLARLAAAVFGVASVLLVFAIGRRLYDATVGLAAAGIFALMPYHVVVSRQVLLDGPMVFFELVAIYALVRFAQSGRAWWLYATSAGLGLSFLTKETAAVNVGIVVLFLALTPAIKVKLRHLIGAGALLGLMMIEFPLAVSSTKRQNQGHNFLVWQLVRRPNHTFDFYLRVIPPALGWGVVILAVIGLVATWRRRSWREILLISWIVVPAAFFELWPVKGFQYLLPIAPAIAIAAARGLVWFVRWPRLRSSRALELVAVPLVIVALFASLAVPTWRRIQPSTSGNFLAGSGGLAGGREAGHWINRHTPLGSQLLALGPSMANVVQYYGRRQTYGLSVSTNPLHRNPVYIPLDNPDRAISEGQVQYLVWDSYTSGRTSFYTSTLYRYITKYNGRLVHIVRVHPGDRKSRIVVKIYEVRP